MNLKRADGCFTSNSIPCIYSGSSNLHRAYSNSGDELRVTAAQYCMMRVTKNEGGGGGKGVEGRSGMGWEPARKLRKASKFSCENKSVREMSNM